MLPTTLVGSEFIRRVQVLLAVHNQAQIGRWRGHSVAVLLALVVGVGVGIAASGGVDWFVADRPAMPPTRQESVAASGQTSTPVEEVGARPLPMSRKRPFLTSRPRRIRPVPPTARADRNRRSRQNTGTPADTPTPDAGPPENAAQRFVEAWSGGDYHGLYADAQRGLERRQSREQDFVDRFEAINTEVGITDSLRSKRPAGRISISTSRSRSVTPPARSETSPRTTRSISTREGADWQVDWSPSLIFTQLGRWLRRFHGRERAPGQHPRSQRQPAGLRRYGQRDWGNPGRVPG